MTADMSPEDLILGMIDANLEARVVDKSPHRDYRARVPLSAVPALLEAADLRGMTISAYLRRAGLAFAAYDLGLSLDELLEDEPVSQLRWRNPGGNPSARGRGHGLWRIGGLL